MNVTTLKKEQEQRKSDWERFQMNELKLIAHKTLSITKLIEQSPAYINFSFMHKPLHASMCIEILSFVLQVETIKEKSVMIIAIILIWIYNFISKDLGCCHKNTNTKSNIQMQYIGEKI